MKVKHFAAALMAGVLAVSVAMPVWAADGPIYTAVPDDGKPAEQKTQELAVDFTVPDSYIISIPSKISMKPGEALTANITATEMNIKKDYGLFVHLSNTNTGTALEVTGPNDKPVSLTLARDGDTNGKEATVKSLLTKDEKFNVSGTYAFSVKDTPVVAIFTDQGQGQTPFNITFGIPAASGENQAGTTENPVIKAGTYSATVMFTVYDAKLSE